MQLQMNIYEQFTSIQGEGLHAGEVMGFIRMSGCNLKCIWCDTTYAQPKNAHTSLTIDEIRIPDTEWVCITGGEPLFQEGALLSLIMRLKDHDKKIEIETNGSFPAPSWAFHRIANRGGCRDHEGCIPLVDLWVVDIKMPSSGNESDLDVIATWRNERTSFKAVVADPQDLQSVSSWLDPVEQQIIVSPAMINGKASTRWMAEVARFCIVNRPQTRLSLQLHKIIWGDKRGV